MAMTAFEIFGVLKLDKADFDSGLKSAEKSASSFGSAIGGGVSAAVGVGIKAIGAATAAVGVFAGSAVSAGAAFDQAMGGVAATAGKSVSELEQEVGEVDTAYGHFSGTLREFAMYMGQNTTFSATEAANALNYMALAGYNTTESMSMLPSVLSMAAAGGMDLAKASDMITDTQSALGLNFERTGQMVNEFAKAASSGNTSVEQLGEAMLRVGGLGAELNDGLMIMSDGSTATIDNVQQLEIAFTAMANAGIKGSEAGTHMRNMLLKLASPTDDGAAAFEALGVSIFDAEGNMKSLGDIFESLDAGLSQLTQEEKLQAISDIFNTRDTAAAEALMNAMGQDWNEIGEAILQADGAADEMSKTKLDNLTGDMTLFKSALESAQITISDQLTPYLRDFVQLGTKGVQDMTTAFNEGGLTGAMNAFGSVLSEGLGMVTTILPEAVSAGIQLIEALGKGIVDNAPAIFTAFVDIAGQLAGAGLDLMQAVADGMKDFDFGQATKDVIEFLKQAFTSDQASTFLDLGIEIATSLFNGLMEAIPEVIQGGTDFLSFLSDAVANTDFSTIASSIMTSLTEAFSGVGDYAMAGAELIMNLSQGMMDALPSITEGAVNIINSLAEGITQNLPELITTGMNMLMDFSGSLRENVGYIVDAGLNLIMALAESLIDNLPVFIETIPTIITNIAGIINDNAPKLIVAGVTLIGKLVVGIIQAIPTIIAEFPKIIQMIVSVWTAFNWLSLGSKIITFITNGVKSLASNIPSAMQSIGEKALNLFRSINWHSLGSSVITLIKNGIQSLVSLIPNALRAIGMAALELVKKIDWLKLGVDIVAGIVSGCKTMATALIDVMVELAKSAWSAVKKFFGIESPSKLMRDTVGKNIVLGMAEGIEDNQDVVADAMGDLTDLVESPDMVVGAKVQTRGSDYDTMDEEDAGIINYDMLANAIVKAFVKADISVEMDNREFGRLVRKEVMA